MKSIPRSWDITFLNNLGRWGSGGTPSKSDRRNYDGGTIPWLVIGDLNDGEIDGAATKITAIGLSNSSARLVPINTVLVAMYGSIGKTGLTGIECATNQAIAHCQTYEGISHRYAFRLMQWLKPVLIAQGQGGAQQNISQAVLKQQIVPVAPLAEQKRIAEKLDTVLTRVDACRDSLARVAPLLKRFRQSVLAAATSGRLTEDWRKGQTNEVDPIYLIQQRKLTARGSREAKIVDELILARPPVRSSRLPNSWLATCVGLIGSVSNGSTPSRAESSYWNGNIPWVSSGEVRDSRIFSTRECISDLGFQNTSVRLLPKGAVLIAMIGEGKTRGQSSVLEIEACINQNIASVVAENGVVQPDYLWYWFQGQYESNRSEGNGTGPQALNCQRVRELPIHLPPIEEQTEIIRRIETLFAFAHRLEARLKTAQTAADRLTPALLAKAFRGELVPQDPNDEPVSELLQRLTASRNNKVPRLKA